MTDDFDLQLETSRGRLVVRSATTDAAEWIQVRVPVGASLRARVSMKSTWDFWGASPTRRKDHLYVVGSTAALADTEIGGDHQIEVPF